MGTPAIRLQGLAKTFGRGRRQVQAVRGIDLEVEAGQVFGFLGPNGAGKSTTIRMIMDLIRPSAGRVEVFGKTVGSDARALERVGALVEGARFYSHLSGRRNLEVLARTSGCYDRKEIDGLLHRLGMAGRADRPVGGYSMGMKQRLGVAAALLARPQLLILDEPTNGLDPAGIREMRSFIRELVDRDGLTVFLSSHLLTEVEQVCHRLAIVQHGCIARQGAVGDLLDGGMRLRVRAAPRETARQVLAEAWPCQEEGGALLLEIEPVAAPEVARRLVEAEVSIFEITPRRPSLEHLFFDVTEASAEGQQEHTGPIDSEATAAGAT